mmetsp:Transcript_19104/g.57102  ORF Transcript_19104/g.57102 Transcript_19104/m.57102 type:complete len:413 (-) Transcript_19104:449-1687(-)
MCTCDRTSLPPLSVRGKPVLRNPGHAQSCAQPAVHQLQVVVEHIGHAFEAHMAADPPSAPLALQIPNAPWLTLADDLVERVMGHVLPALLLDQVQLHAIAAGIPNDGGCESGVGGVEVTGLIRHGDAARRGPDVCVVTDGERPVVSGSIVHLADHAPPHVGHAVILGHLRPTIREREELVIGGEDACRGLIPQADTQLVEVVRTEQVALFVRSVGHQSKRLGHGSSHDEPIEGLLPALLELDDDSAALAPYLPHLGIQPNLNARRGDDPLPQGLVSLFEHGHETGRGRVHEVRVDPHEAIERWHFVGGAVPLGVHGHIDKWSQRCEVALRKPRLEGLIQRRKIHLAGVRREHVPGSTHGSCPMGVVRIGGRVKLHHVAVGRNPVMPERIVRHVLQHAPERRRCHVVQHGLVG